jgi:hypothetical protein
VKYRPYNLGKDQPGKMYLTINGLIARGWTQTMIETLLGEPCKTVQHPRWRVPASVWHIDRARKIEQTEQFRRLKGITLASEEKAG